MTNTAMEKEITLEQALAWSNKHRQLTSDGARLVHIKQLLQLHSSSQLKQIREEIEVEKTKYFADEGKERVWDMAIDKSLSIIDSHMEEKEQEEK